MSAQDTPTALSEAELDAHIQSCSRQLEAVYDRFEQHHLPGDRDAATELLHMRDEAIRSRSPAHQARLAAELEKRIDEGLAFFAVTGAADARELQGVEQ